jgi:hypothetical protein
VDRQKLNYYGPLLDIESSSVWQDEKNKKSSKKVIKKIATKNKAMKSSSMKAAAKSRTKK